MASACSAKVAVDEINDLLTCSMCLKTLTEPRSLPCFHNFCVVCIRKYVQRLREADKKIDTFSCPTCRSDFTLKSNRDVVDLPSTYFIQNLLKIMEIQEKAKASPVCSNCQNSAISRCSSCEMFMCKKCSEWHDIWPGNKNHDLLSVQELSDPECQVKMKKRLYCKEHECKILEYYCETCKHLCCIDCVVLDQQKPGHSFVAIRKIAQKKKETLQSSCKTLDENVSEGREALNNVIEMMKSLERNSKIAKGRMKKQKDNVLKIVAEKLDEKEEEMSKEVDKIYVKMHKELNEQHDEIKEYLGKLQASVSLPKNLLNRGSIEEILSSQNLIDEKIAKLTNERPDDLSAVNDGVIDYIPGEIGSINFDDIVDKLGCVKGNPSKLAKFRTSSSILNGKAALMKQLQQWLGKKCEWNLCYRASRDGWKAQDFHRHCDDKGPTVVLVKTNDCIFGGYTDQNWSSGDGFYKHSNCSFLFSLSNNDNLAPFTANIENIRQECAIYCHPSCGPIFGEGFDLLIGNNPQVDYSYTNFGYTYQLPPGYAYESERARKLLAGQCRFKPTEIEVFN